jgi:hypothetical protein
MTRHRKVRNNQLGNIKNTGVQVDVVTLRTGRLLWAVQAIEITSRFRCFLYLIIPCPAIVQRHVQSWKICCTHRNWVTLLLRREDRYFCQYWQGVSDSIQGVSTILRPDKIITAVIKKYYFATTSPKEEVFTKNNFCFLRISSPNRKLNFAKTFAKHENFRSAIFQGRWSFQENIHKNNFYFVRIFVEKRKLTFTKTLAKHENFRSAIFQGRWSFQENFHKK